MMHLKVTLNTNEWRYTRLIYSRLVNTHFTEVSLTWPEHNILCVIFFSQICVKNKMTQDISCVLVSKGRCCEVICLDMCMSKKHYRLLGRCTTAHILQRLTYLKSAVCVIKFLVLYMPGITRLWKRDDYNPVWEKALTMCKLRTAGAVLWHFHVTTRRGIWMVMWALPASHGEPRWTPKGPSRSRA